MADLEEHQENDVEQADTGVDLRTYMRAVRKLWWIVLVFVLLGTAAGGLLAFTGTRTYESSVTFFVATPTSNSDSTFNASQFGTERVNSYVGLATSDRLASMIVGDLGLNESPQALASRISASAPLNTVLLTVKVKDSSGPKSLAIADSLSRQFVSLVATLEATREGAAGTAPVRLDVVSGPVLNPAPISPRRKLDVALGFLLGLVLGVAVAVGRDLLDVSIRSTDQLADVTGLPILASIPRDRRSGRFPIVQEGATRSPRGEAIRQLRTNLLYADVDHDITTVVLASARASEGKSLTAANLAVVAAGAGRSVVLIDGDLRRPKLQDYLGIEGGVGLSEVLTNQVELDDALQVWGHCEVRVLTSGSLPPNPSEMLGSRAFQALLEELRSRFDLIVIDAPPLLAVTDGAVLAALADGTILVVRHGKTARHQILNSIRSLRAIDARILGAVLNLTPERPRGYAGYQTYGPPRRGLRDIRGGTRHLPVPPFRDEPAAVEAAVEADDEPVDTRSAGQ